MKHKFNRFSAYSLLLATAVGGALATDIEKTLIFDGISSFETNSFAANVMIKVSDSEVSSAKVVFKGTQKDWGDFEIDGDDGVLYVGGSNLGGSVNIVQGFGNVVVGRTFINGMLVSGGSYGQTAREVKLALFHFVLV